jgi:hypothetical protein
LEDERVKALADRLNARVWDDLGILRGLSYPPLGFLVQLANVATKFRLARVAPEKSAGATAIKRSVSDCHPCPDGHSSLIWPFSKPLTDYISTGLEFRNPAFLGGRPN